MKVILFKTSEFNPFSWLISLVSRSKYTHAGLLIGGEVYDASEARGSVGIGGNLSKWGRRKVEVFSVKDQWNKAEPWAISQVGVKYDYKGVLGWLFADHENRKLYCFEYVVAALQKAGYPVEKQIKLSGNDVRAYFGEPEYAGPAREYKNAR